MSHDTSIVLGFLEDRDKVKKEFNKQFPHMDYERDFEHYFRDRLDAMSLASRLMGDLK